MAKYLISLWLIINVTSPLQALGNAAKTNMAGTLQAEINKPLIFDETKKGIQENTLFTCDDVFKTLRQLKEIANKKPELKNPEMQESGARIAKLSFGGEESDVMIFTGGNTKLEVYFILSRDQTNEKSEELFKQYKQVLIQCKPSNWKEFVSNNIIFDISNYSSGKVGILGSGSTITIEFSYYIPLNEPSVEVPLTCPNILGVFNAFKDGSIRGAQTSSTYDRSTNWYNTTINFEKQVESVVTVSYNSKDSSYKAQFVLLNTRSNEESQQKYNELKRQIKNCVPSDWFEKDYSSGSGAEATNNYQLSEKEDRSSGKNIRIDKTFYEHSYTITLQLEYK